MRIAHIFSSNAPHLSRQIAPFVVELMPESVVYIANNAGNGYAKLFSEDNKSWFAALSNNNKGGIIKAARWMDCRRLKHGYLAVVCRWLIPMFGLNSFLKIIKSPRRWVVHGYAYPLATIFFLRCLLKKVVVINWGGPPQVHRRGAVLDRMALRLHHTVFVLMSPERRYFENIFRNVMTLPYPTRAKISNEVSISMENSSNSRSIILGNSSWCRDGYCKVLDRLVPNEWDRIVCMLNYGNEDDEKSTDLFVKRYKKKFGDSFYAWRETVPFEIYKRIMGESAYYICPSQFQSGLGAIYQSVRGGKTILVAGDNYKWLRDIGLKVYNINDIDDFTFLSLNTLKLSKNDISNNLNILNKFLCYRYTPDIWAKQIKAAFD